MLEELLMLRQKVKDMQAILDAAKMLVKNIEYDSRDPNNYYYYSCYGADYFKDLIELLS